MRRIVGGRLALSVVFLLAAAIVLAQQAVTCVGLYSETAAGSVSYRVADGDWVVVKVGDKIRVDAEIRINVDRDWLEITPPGNLNAVYTITGRTSGEVLQKVSDILKGRPRTVAFPGGNADKPDPKFQDKRVVTEYLGRQIYMPTEMSIPWDPFFRPVTWG